MALAALAVVAGVEWPHPLVQLVHRAVTVLLFATLALLSLGWGDRAIQDVLLEDAALVLGLVFESLTQSETEVTATFDVCDCLD